MTDPEDSVDALLASWGERRPDLDFSPVAVLTRLARVRRHVDVELDGVFAEFGLDPARFAVLATLARLAGDGGLAPERLMAEIGLSGTALAERLDLLEADGLVTRGASVALTARGAALFDEAVAVHLRNGRRVLSALPAEEQAALSALLRRLLVEFEGTRPAGPPRLGMTVAPAHMTAQLRETVGRPPVDGLLVQHVERGGPAAAAGLRTGDVLLRAGAEELRSVTALYRALRAAGDGLAVVVLRGEDEVPVELPVSGDGATAAASPGRAAFAEHVV